jgi:hypothetical protein
MAISLIARMRAEERISRGNNPGNFAIFTAIRRASSRMVG